MLSYKYIIVSTVNNLNQEYTYNVCVFKFDIQQ